MNDLFSNAIDIITIICAIITAILVIKTIKHVRAEKKEAQASIDKDSSQLDDYDAILERTRDLEFNRESNKGQHFDDESVYLKRANQIRVNSPFFSWVK